MKIIITFLVFICIVSSCKNDSKIKSIKSKVIVDNSLKKFLQSENGIEIDSNILKDKLYSKKDSSLALMYAYSKIKMINNYLRDSSSMKRNFYDCTSTLDDTCLYIYINDYQPTFPYFGGDYISIKLTKDFMYSAKLGRTCDIPGCDDYYYPTVQLLTLSKNYYKKGDTIYGKLFFRKDTVIRLGGPETRIIDGYFRTIVF